MDLDLHHLRAVDALAAEGSIRAAAKRLGVSQPALSRLVARIERVVGLPLLDRGPTGVRLTEAGAVVARYSTRTTALMSDLRAELAELQPRPGGVLRVAASLAPALTLDFLLGRGYDVDAVQVPDAVALHMVDQSQVDIALVVADPFVPYRPPPGVRVAPIMSTPLWAHFARGGATGLPDPVSLADLAGHPWLLPAEGSLRRIVKRAWADSGVEPRVRLSGDTKATLRATENGAGVSLHQPVCGAFFGADTVSLPLREELYERKLCVWRPQVVGKALVSQLVELQQRTHRVLAATNRAYSRLLDRVPDVLPSARALLA